jgi:hypothetical protein
MQGFNVEGCILHIGCLCISKTTRHLETVTMMKSVPISLPRLAVSFVPRLSPYVVICCIPPQALQFAFLLNNDFQKQYLPLIQGYLVVMESISAISNCRVVAQN